MEVSGALAEAAEGACCLVMTHETPGDPRVRAGAAGTGRWSNLGRVRKAVISWLAGWALEVVEAAVRAWAARNGHGPWHLLTAVTLGRGRMALG
jgi:hypothetical protein